MSVASSQTQDSGASIPFGAGQFALLLTLGAILWFVAALMLKAFAPMGVYEGGARAVLYALIVPGTVPFLFLSLRIAKVDRRDYFVAYSIMTMSAMFLDGVALAWFPTLYGGTAEYVAGAGGTILWGAAVGMALALILNKRK